MSADFSQDTDEERAFRADLRAFIIATIPPDMAARVRRGYHPLRADVEFWTRALLTRGWSVPGWPVEQGGPGWTLRQRHIFEEESLALGAPEVSPPGNALVGPILSRFGSQQQKDRFLPKIRTGEEFWAQAFSEPNAGSDLASLRTRAQRDGDCYIVNGQKIWTTEAHIADWLFLLVRTDPAAAKPQAGISFLLVDIKSPGVNVRPIMSIDEGHSLNEVFFDDVRVPTENLVGEENQGWRYAKVLLGDERSFSAAIGRCKRELSRLKLIAETPARGRPLIEEPTFAIRVAQLEIELLAHEATVWRVVADEEAGVDTGKPTASVLKVKGSELLQSIEQLTIEALGDYAAPVYPESEYRLAVPAHTPAPDYAPGVVSEFMYRRAMTIYGGTNEIQRNIIAAALLRE